MNKKYFQKSIIRLGFCLSACLFSPLPSYGDSSEDPWNFDLEADLSPFSQPVLYSIDQKPQNQLQHPQAPHPQGKTLVPSVGKELDQKDFDKIKLIAEDGKSDALLYQGAIDSYLKQLDTQNSPPNPLENEEIDLIQRDAEKQAHPANVKKITPNQNPVTPVTLERSQAPRTVPVNGQGSAEKLNLPDQTIQAPPATPSRSNDRNALPSSQQLPIGPVTNPAAPNPLFEAGSAGGSSRPAQAPANDGIIQGLQPAAPLTPPTREELDQRTISINFNNVNMVEFIRFVSRISGRNFLFDENDLQFNVTILFDEPTSIENILTALLQALRIHDLVLLEEGNNLIIHKNPKVGFLSQVVTEENLGKEVLADIITQVFKLNTVDVDTASAVLKPLLSDSAQISVVKNTNHLIVTDLATNIREVGRLLKSIDSPQSGLVIGQYVVRFAFIDTLIQLAQRIMQPISQDQPLIFVPHNAANSIFIVSTPYFVERTISILQYLDQNQGTTQILNPKDLQYAPGQGGLDAKWKLDSNGNWIYDTQTKGNQPPRGRWVLDSQGNWRFEPGEPGDGESPEGRWVLNSQGIWVYQLNPGKPISPTTLKRVARFSQDLPVGNIARTQFFIHKLRYRRGDQIVQALTRIAESLQAGGNANPELIATIAGIQWIESPNSLVVTGTSEAIEKLQDLIDEIDTPLRQVFLEMLILEMDVNDSQEFAVNPGARFGGGNTAGNENFLSGITTLPAMLNSTGLGVVPNPAVIPPVNSAGFTLGVIGQTITRNGTQFASLGALVSCISQQDATRIVLNPKILTEDNSPAEIFVGENTQFPTQSIANNNGNIVTQNFEFRDVGTRLKVTPLIGNNDIITLDIQEEVSRVASGGTQNISNLSNQVVGPTTTVNRTTTRVHMPDRYFLVLSGNLSDTERRLRTQVPCLGGIPILGAAFSDKFLSDQRVNLMIFIYPQIIDTIEQLQNLTKHEQDIFRVKCRRKSQWRWDTDEALDWLNLEDWENNEGEWDCY